MKGLAVVMVLLCALMINVPVVMADEIADTGVTDTATSSVTATNPTLDEPSSSNIPYKTVTPDAAAAKFEGLFNKGYEVIAKTITSLAVFVFAVCCVILLIASIFKIEAARKFGLGGIFCAGLGLLIFYSIPFIISFIQGIGMYLNS